MVGQYVFEVIADGDDWRRSMGLFSSHLKAKDYIIEEMSAKLMEDGTYEWVSPRHEWNKVIYTIEIREIR